MPEENAQVTTEGSEATEQQQTAEGQQINQEGQTSTGDSSDSEGNGTLLGGRKKVQKVRKAVRISPRVLKAHMM